MSQELLRLPLHDVAALIHSRRISSVEVTHACVEAARRVNETLHCFVAIDPEEALTEARRADDELANGRYRGPLHGIPLAHKDMFYEAGKRSTGGSKIRREFVANTTATVIRRLKDAGSVTVGRLAMSEFAAWPTGHNDHYGTPRNPWNTAYVTGGSSSGSACAVAARTIFASLGSDTGGSIRLPAGICGVVGLKPTNGRVSLHGTLPRVWSLDAVGPIARTVRDAAILLGAIAGHDTLDPTSLDVAWPPFRHSDEARAKGIRIALPEDPLYTETEPEMLRQLELALDVFRNMGAVVVRVRLPDTQRLYALADVVGKVEAAALHQEWIRERPDDYEPAVRARIESGFYIPAIRYLDALRLRSVVLREFVEQVFAAADVLFLPTLTTEIPTIEETAFTGTAATPAIIARMTLATRAVNYLGLPAVSIPCGFTPDGLPAAFQLVGRPLDEAKLLRLGESYENRTNWARHLPAICQASDSGEHAPFGPMAMP